MHAYIILAKTQRNAHPSLKYTLFLCIHLKTFPSVFCTTAFRFRPPPGTQASMQSSISGWWNLTILLCILCTPIQTVITLPVHRSCRSLENVKHQSLSSNNLTLYIGLTVQCAWRAENLQKNRQRHFLFRIRPTFHLYYCLFLFQRYALKIYNPTNYGKTVLQWTKHALQYLS